MHCILVEKPVALNPKELRRFKELQETAKKQGQIIMSCLPRLTDVRYRQLLDMMPSLRKEFRVIKTFMHGLNAQQEHPQ